MLPFDYDVPSAQKKKKEKKARAEECLNLLTIYACHRNNLLKPVVCACLVYTQE